MSNTVLLWGQIVTIVTFIIALFVLYRLLVDQKDATIQLLKEKIDWLQKELDFAKESSPDVLIQQLKRRIDSLNEEMERLVKDKSISLETIRQKDAEMQKQKEDMKIVIGMLENLTANITIAGYMLKGRRKVSSDGTITVVEPLYVESNEAKK